MASCLHDLSALGDHGLAALMVAMLAAGLGGGLHCAGMCGPFVIAQLEAGAAARPGGFLLLPYHLGRMTGYALLGAVAGLAGAVLSLASRGPLLAVPLLAAATILVLQAFGRLPHLPPPPGLSRLLAPLTRRVVGAAGRLRGYSLGLMLSALPCGLLYAALAAAAGAGSAAAGALAMAAFAVGTMPALMGVGLVGRLFGRRFGGTFARLRPAMLGFNALLLASLAGRMLLVA